MKKVVLLISIFLITGSSCADTKAIRDDVPPLGDLPLSCGSCQTIECVDMAKALCQLKNRIGISDCGDYTVFQLLCLIKNSIGDDLFTVESKIDIIDDNVDTLVGCAYTPLTQDDVVGGLITLDTPGNYCLSTDLTATVTITADNVCLCLNNRELTGRVVIDAEDIMVNKGAVTPFAPTSDTDAAQAAVEITTNGARAQI